LISETGRKKDGRELRVLLGYNGKKEENLKNCAPNILLIETKEREKHIYICGTYNTNETKKKPKKGNFSRTRYSGERIFLFYCSTKG